MTLVYSTSVRPAPTAPDPDPARTSWSVTRDPALQLVLLVFAVLFIAALSMNVVRTTYGIKGDEQHGKDQEDELQGRIACH